VHQLLSDFAIHSLQCRRDQHQVRVLRDAKRLAFSTVQQ